MPSITVLLADDHAIIRDSLRILLDTQPDIEVIGDTTNSRQAVQLATELQPDVVVMDITMPELNGIEATAQICQACPPVQVVLLSMFTSVEHCVRALKAGAAGYLLKESAGTEVIDAIRAVFAGHRYLSQRVKDMMLDEYVHEHEIMEPARPLARLSPRERETFFLVVEGKSSTEIGSILSLSPKTVDTYRSRLMQKLHVTNLPALVRFAIQNGLTPLE